MISVIPAEVVIDDWHIELIAQQLAMVYLHRSASRMDNAVADEASVTYVTVFINNESHKMVPYLVVGLDDEISHIVLGSSGPQHSMAVVVSMEWDDTTVHQLTAELPLADKEGKYCNLKDAFELVLALPDQ